MRKGSIEWMVFGVVFALIVILVLLGVFGKTISPEDTLIGLG